MKTMKYLLLFVFSLSIASSCAKLDELSDTNTIMGLSISEHWPKSIEIDTEPAYVGDTIFIPVIYGKYDFPLYFRAELKVDNDVYKVMGIDFSRELVLNTMDDELKFYVMAKSGKTRVYIIKAKEKMPLEENNYILAPVEITTPVESDMHFASMTTRTLSGDTIKLSAINTTYPARITPKFTIVPGAEFRNFDNGTTTLVFNNAKTVHRLKVVSQSGAEKIWNIVLNDLPLVNSTTPGADVKSTAINPRDINVTIAESSAGSGIDINEFFTDNSNNTIKIIVDSKTAAMARKSMPKGAAARIATMPSSGLNVLVDFPIYEGVTMEGLTKGTPLTFASYDEIKKFYMFDPMAGTAREWTVTVEPYRQNQANVTAFSFTAKPATIRITRTSRAASIDIDPNFVEVFPNDGKIFIKATDIRSAYCSISDHKEPWGLTVIPSFTLSKGASCNTTEFVWETNHVHGFLGIGAHDNDAWKYPISFKVTAEDGTEKEWSLNILEPNQGVSSDQCELFDFGINKVVPNYTKFDGTTPIIRDDNNKTISIKIAEYNDKLPLKIYPNCTVSEYATIVTSMPLVFNTADDVLTMTIKAKNGNTSDWSVNLLLPEKAEGADIEKFTVSALTPNEFKFNSTILNAEIGLVKIKLSSDGKYPLKVDYRLDISEGASTADGLLTGNIIFTSAREVKTIKITSQSGSEKLWVVKLDYRPQVPYGNFNTWTDEKNVAGIRADGKSIWANANNNMVTGTKKGTGSSGAAGDYAPVMTTGETVGFKAAGSTFTGYFVFDAGVGMSDPVAITFQGYPLAPATKIIGVKMDVKYTPVGNDYGSLLTELVYWDGAKPYEYHGNKPGANYTSAPHAKNTARSVAKCHFILSPNAGKAPSGETLTQVKAGDWVTLTLPMPYGEGAMPNFTHFNVICSSSAYGDAFIGNVGSQLQIDNVEILYDENE